MAGGTGTKTASMIRIEADACKGWKKIRLVGRFSFSGDSRRGNWWTDRTDRTYIREVGALFFPQLEPEIRDLSSFLALLRLRVPYSECDPILYLGVWGFRYGSFLHQLPWAEESRGYQ